MLLLAECWDEGSLPDDEAELQSIADVSDDEWSRLWTAVERKFPVQADGRRHNEKIDAELAEVAEVRARRSAAGRKGGSKSQASAKREPSKCQANAKQNSSMAEADADTETTTTRAATSRPVDPDGSTLAHHLAEVMAKHDGSKPEKPSRSSCDGFGLLTRRLARGGEREPVERVLRAINGVFVSPGLEFWADNARSGKSWNGKTKGGEWRFLKIERDLAKQARPEVGQAKGRNAELFQRARQEGGLNGHS
jgi:uncharacterized protein YdaU (DUF1376 family)